MWECSSTSSAFCQTSLLYWMSTICFLSAPNDCTSFAIVSLQWFVLSFPSPCLCNCVITKWPSDSPESASASETLHSYTVGPDWTTAELSSHWTAASVFIALLRSSVIIRKKKNSSREGFCSRTQLSHSETTGAFSHGSCQPCIDLLFNGGG